MELSRRCGRMAVFLEYVLGIEMRLKKIELTNFRAAKNLPIDLHPRMNLIIGVNGAGKSTVLQSIALGLIALVRSLHNVEENKKLIPVSDISNGEDFACIEIQAEFSQKVYGWKICRSRPGANVAKENDLAGLSVLSHALKERFNADEALPIIAYYPVGRVVEKVGASMGARISSSQESLDVYDNALEGRPNFHNFFRWFRDQDDYVNQKSLSRSHWIKRNTPRLRWQISQLFDAIGKLIPSDKRNSAFSREERMRSFDFIIHEPRFMFREMSIMIQSLEIRDISSSGFEKILYELDYMIHRMDMLADDGRDSVADSKGNLLEILSRVLELMCLIRIEERKNVMILDVLWSMFMLSFELGLWWLSNEGHNRLIDELSTVHWPTRQGEMKEFRVKIVDTVNRIIDSDIRKRSSAQNNFGRDIENVTRAIESFVSEYTNLRINRSERGAAQMLVDKGGQEFDIAQLSDGEKNIIALVGDIARRLTIGNPNSPDPLLEPGIVLIDELDLHLHPKWQRIFAQKISEVFPNCQFVVSSHSPQVISHVKSESIIALRHSVGGIVRGYVNESYGKNSDRILEDVMDETARPKDIDEKIKSIFRLIQAGQIPEAQGLISKLRFDIGEDADLIKAGVLMKRREIIGK